MPAYVIGSQYPCDVGSEFDSESRDAPRCRRPPTPINTCVSLQLFIKTILMHKSLRIQFIGKSIMFLAAASFVTSGCAMLLPGNYTQLQVSSQNVEYALEPPTVAIFLDETRIYRGPVKGGPPGIGHWIDDFETSRGNHHVVVYLIKADTTIEVFNDVHDFSKRYSYLEVFHGLNMNLKSYGQDLKCRDCDIAVSCWTTDIRFVEG